MNSPNNRIMLCGQERSYLLTRKKVKNINLRIRQDGMICVSAPKSVPLWQIEDFLHRKEAWICRALAALEPPAETLTEQQAYLLGEAVEIPAGEDREQWLQRMAEELLPAAYEQAWLLFQNDGFPKPQLRLRKMKSRWGSCIPAKGRISLNSLLIGAPADCQVAVAAHELAHMLVPNHSAQFYSLLEQRLPDYKKSHKQLKTMQTLLFHLW